MLPLGVRMRKVLSPRECKSGKILSRWVNGDGNEETFLNPRSLRGPVKLIYDDVFM
jgi:hypothetical protein